MSSVTNRIKEVTQPRGGFLNPSQMTIECLDDGKELNEGENIHGSLVGLAVDYLTRFVCGTKPEDAFRISLKGASIAEKLGMKNALMVATFFLSKLERKLDSETIQCATKLVSFDVWYRNTPVAPISPTHREVNPNKETIENIRILVKRSTEFFKKYGPVTADGFTFEPVDADPEKDAERLAKLKKWTYGGYTSIVDAGDGDFLTKDTLWDFKVTKAAPTSKHTLQLLMYWIMGKHSGQPIYKNIDKIGIYNPRFNKVYTYKVSDLPKETIEYIEKEIICY